MRLRLLFDTLVFDYELPSFFFVSNDLRCKNAAQCSYYESDADAPCLSVSTNTSRFGHVLFRPNSANLVYYAVSFFFLFLIRRLHKSSLVNRSHATTSVNLRAVFHIIFFSLCSVLRVTPVS